MTWERILDQYTTLIENELTKYLNEITNAAKSYHAFIERIYLSLKEFNLRKGKRIASCSTLITYKGYTGRVTNNILKVCVGIELYRHSILVHDDLVDGDMFRRGGKTIHEIFSEQYNRRAGDSIAIFAGNILYALAINSIIVSNFNKDKLNKVIRIISEGYKNVNESQILDLIFEYKEPNIQEWYIMASKRAASLFKTTILTGAILGDGPERDLPILEKAAEHIGYSFDIQDDIIDMFASHEQYGRPPGGDIAHGKKPLHVIYGLWMAKPEDVRKLRQLLGKGTINSKELDLIKRIIVESGALEAAKKKSREHVEAAKELINKTSLSLETKEFFASLLSYIEKSLDWYN